MSKRSFGVIGAIGAAILIIGGLFMGAICLERIPAGYVGVVYSVNGGVQDEVLDQGWHLVAPGKKVKEFTVGNEQLILSKDAREGSEEDESFVVATSDNANMRVSFQMSYRFDRSEVTNTYQNFRGMNGESIVNSRVRTVLKSKVNEVTRNYSMMGLYSEKRGEINNDLTNYLNKELHKQFGIEVLDASIIDVHPSKSLQKAISARVTALQEKQEAKAKQETIKVQNETEIMKAEAKKQKIEAEAKAEVVRIEAEAQAEAQAEANKQIANSLTPELVEKIMYDKWDGKLPMVGSDSGSIINFDSLNHSKK